MHTFKVNFDPMMLQIVRSGEYRLIFDLSEVVKKTKDVKKSVSLRNNYSFTAGTRLEIGVG